MQALSIYILIRVDEGETEDNNFDFLLIKTIIVSLSQVNNIPTNQPHTLVFGDSK